MDIPSSVLILFLVILPLPFIFLVVLAVLLFRLVGRLSGWPTLGRLYGANRPPAGHALTRQTAKVGPVQWKRCLTIAVGPDGLYVAVQSRLLLMLRWIMPQNPPILIPWCDISGVQETTLYWRRAVLLSVGRPQITTITLFAELFAAMQPYLTASAPR